jgi:hypothetical protein
LGFVQLASAFAASGALLEKPVLFPTRHACV